MKYEIKVLFYYRRTSDRPCESMRSIVDEKWLSEHDIPLDAYAWDMYSTSWGRVECYVESLDADFDANTHKALRKYRPLTELEIELVNPLIRLERDERRRGSFNCWGQPFFLE